MESKIVGNTGKNIRQNSQYISGKIIADNFCPCKVCVKFHNCYHLAFSTHKFNLALIPIPMIYLVIGFFSVLFLRILLTENLV